MDYLFYATWIVSAFAIAVSLVLLACAVRERWDGHRPLSSRTADSLIQYATLSYLIVALVTFIVGCAQLIGTVFR